MVIVNNQELIEEAGGAGKAREAEGAGITQLARVKIKK